MIRQKPAISPSSQPIIPKEHGQEHEEERVCQASTSGEKTCLTGTTVLAPVNQRRYELFLLLSLPIPCLRQHSKREAVEKKEVLRGQREKEKGTHLPLIDDFNPTPLL